MTLLLSVSILSLLLLPLAIGIVQHYASPGTSCSIRLLVVLSFWLGFGGIVLLPIDLSLTTNTAASSSSSSSSAVNNDHAESQEAEENNADAYGSASSQPPEPNATYQPWLVTYWSTFILAWLVLPPIRKALLSGHFTPLTRIRDAVCTSLKIYMMLFSALVAAIVFLAIHLRSWHVIPILMALSNTYGMLLVALLLGYGLVDVPRKMWRRAAPDVELRRAQILANAADEALFDAVWELQDCEDEIDAAVQKIHVAHGNFIVSNGSNGSGGSPTVAAEAANGGSGGEVPPPPQFIVTDEEMEMDGTMTYDECVQELVRRRNLTANLSTQLQSRRTKRTDRIESTESSSPSSSSTNGGGGEEGTGRNPPAGSPIRKSGKHTYSPPSNGTTDDDGGNGLESKDLDVPSIAELAALNARLKLAQARLVSAEQNWTEIVERSKLYNARVHGDYAPYMAPPIQPLLSSSDVPLLDKVQMQLDNVGFIIRYIWITRLVSPVSRVVATVFAGLSTLVLWSETVMALPWNLSPFAWFLHFLGAEKEGEKGVTFAIAALIPLLYMSACVYSSLFKISFFGPYCLRGYKQSHGVALIFNAQYLIRMQFPLGFNYLLMLRYDTITSGDGTATNCAFSRVMSDMSTVPFFGTSFSVYAPLLILALCCFTLCDGYPRLLGLLGLEHEDAILLGDRETLDRQVNEGIILLRRHVERTENSSRSGSGSHRTSSPRSPSTVPMVGAVDGDSPDNRGVGPIPRDSSHWWYGVV